MSSDFGPYNFDPNNIPYNVVLPAGVSATNMAQYVSLWRSCCVDFRAESPPAELWKQCAGQLSTRSYDQVRVGAESGSARDLFALGIR